MSERKPNILWICADQQRYDTLGCTGNPYVNTPNLDQLAREGALMNGAYAQSPVCAPSRACFLSGRYPRACGVRQNGQNIPQSERLVPAILRDSGYVCGLSGKLHLSVCSPAACPESERRIDDGYSFFSWSHHPAAAGAQDNWPGNAYTNWLTGLGLAFDTPPLPSCRFVRRGMPAQYSQTHWCFDEAMRFIGAQAPDQPWLFSVNCFDPHHPFDPPEAYLSRYLDHLDDLPLPDTLPGEWLNKPVFQQKDHAGAYDTPGNFPYDAMSERDKRMITAAYYAMIDQLDDNVGRIVRYLKAIGQYENTVIVYMSDHGESLGDHGMYLKGPYFYQNAVHVPLIIRLPGSAPRALRREALVELADLAPTLLQAAGLERAEGMQGRSFLPLLQDANAPDAFRSSVYSAYYNANINHRDPLAFLTMVFDGRYKLVRVHGASPAQGDGELYDLCSDPGEHHNLYRDAAYAAEKTRLLELMTDRMAQTLDPLPLRRAYW